MKMDEIAQLPADERILYFIESASRIGLSPQVVEKDFWVCWILRRVFALTDIGSHITFKGGTSLSKAYGAIRRFSEDVDLAVERSFLGFDGPNDPETAASGKLRRRLREGLSDACKKRVAADIVPQLKDAVSSPLQGQEWRLDLDAEDADGQTEQARPQNPCSEPVAGIAQAEHRAFPPVTGVPGQIAAMPCFQASNRIGAKGFEPSTSWSQTRRSNQAELRPVTRPLRPARKSTRNRPKTILGPVNRPGMAAIRAACGGSASAGGRFPTSG